MKKYEFIKEITDYKGRVLHRIRALKDFGEVKAGDLGGWIEKEENLSHDGNAWVYDNATVTGDAKVFDDATVRDNARVFDNAKVFGNAKISGMAGACENAQVYDNAIVQGEACVFDNAQVFGNAQMSDIALVSGNAQIFDNATVFGVAAVTGSAKVFGDTQVVNDCQDYDEFHSFVSNPPDEEDKPSGNTSDTQQPLTRKYVLTEETMWYEGVLLHRIRAFKDFRDVKAGDLGGWIEKEENLSHEGSAWIYDDAKVFENAIVRDHARIHGRTRISGNANLLGFVIVGANTQTPVSNFAAISGDAYITSHCMVTESSREKFDTEPTTKDCANTPICGASAKKLPADDLLDTLDLKEESEPSSQDSTLEVSVKESDELKARLNRASLASVIRPFAEDSKTIIDNLLGASQQSGIFKASLAQYKEAADKLVYFCMGHSDECCTSQEYALLLAVINSLMLLSNEEDIAGKTSGANLGSDSPLLIRALRPVQKEINEYLAGDSIDADPVRESAKCTQDKAKKMSF